MLKSLEKKLPNATLRLLIYHMAGKSFFLRTLTEKAELMGQAGGEKQT